VITRSWRVNVRVSSRQPPPRECGFSERSVCNETAAGGRGDLAAAINAPIWAVISRTQKRQVFTELA
jgi:hypothetical protein